MEEQEKILEIINNSLENKFRGQCVLNVEYLKSIKEYIENLIKGYRELKEINESFIWQSNFDMKYYEENYIPKSKIKEKLEELESKIKATFCKYMTEEDYYNNKFLSSDVAEDYEVLEVRKLISNRNLLQELMEDK